MNDLPPNEAALRQELRELRQRTAQLERELDACRPDHWSTRAARVVFNSLPEPLIVADRSGAVNQYNAAAQELLGPAILDCPVEQWCETFGICNAAGPSPLDGRGLPLLRALDGESVLGEEIFIRRLPSRPGQNMWASTVACPVLDDDGEVEGAFMLLYNLMPRKEIEEEILLRERAVAASREGIAITDPNLPDNPLVYVNHGFEKLTGYSRDEALGKNCRFLQSGETDPETLDELRSAVRERRACVVELVNKRKDGTTFWNRLSITPVRDASGHVKHFVGVQSDISERVMAEHRLRRITRELEAANLSLRRNLEAAAKVQQALLPHPVVRIPGVEFAWRFQPCEELAGDLLNVFRLDEHRVGMYVLDVSGHGTAAALLSVAVSRVLSPNVSSTSLVKRQTDSESDYVVLAPAEVADELNRTFPWDPATGQFFTIVYAVLDSRTGEFTFVSAGHPGIAILPVEGPPHIPRTTGMPIGVGRERYEDTTLYLEPGDKVFLYSDGLTETMTPKHELFGMERFLDSLDRNRDRPLEDLTGALLEELEAWRGSDTLRDDLSLLAFTLPGARQ